MTVAGAEPVEQGSGGETTAGAAPPTPSPHDGWYWLSSERMTVGVLIRDGKVTKAPPILAKFIGQPAANLRRWLTRQPGFRWAGPK